VIWWPQGLKTFSFQKCMFPNACNGGARDFPKEVGDPQAFSEVKVGRNNGVNFGR